jgi:hypothetical protein
MLNYNRSKILGANPFLVRNGHVRTAYAAINKYGFNPIGIHEPIQASAASSSFEDYAGRFRWVPCITQVFDWPYATDDIGVEYDQANLLAVRTRACHSGAGEYNWLTAVPKTPTGYDIKLRMGLLPDPVSDFMGDEPMLGPCAVTYDFGLSEYVYSRNVIRWRTAREIDGFGAGATHTDYQWAPMNLNNHSVNIGPPTDTWYTVGTGFDPGDEIYTKTMLRTNYAAVGAVYAEPLPHVGFRGGKVDAGNDSGSPAAAGTLMLYVGWSDDPDPAAFADITTTWSFDVTSANPYEEQAIGACLAPTSSGPTARKYWFAVQKYTIPSSGDAGYVGDVRLSPRVDIPLHFTAVSGNKIALGGVLS